MEATKELRLKVLSNDSMDTLFDLWFARGLKQTIALTSSSYGLKTVIGRIVFASTMMIQPQVVPI